MLPVVQQSPPTIFLHKAQSQARHHTQSHHRPTRLLHLPIRNHTRGIPSQMPQPIETVVRKRHRDHELRQHLECQWPRGERSSQNRALEVPTQGGRNKVGGAEEVEAAREEDAGDAVQRGAVPGDLRFVDA